MNRVAISTSSPAPNNWDLRLLDYRYKCAKLFTLLPTRSRQQVSDFEDLNFRAQFYKRLWQSAANALGYRFRELGYGFWAVHDGNGNEVRGRGATVNLDSSVNLQMAGNKALCYRLLKNLTHYRMPRYREFRLANVHEALTFLHEQKNRNADASCVIKPARDTGAGAGVTTGICDESALRRAAINASIHSKDLLIEETVAGDSYRLLFLGGKYLHAVRRDPPRLLGDGRSTVRQLIDAENLRRSEAGAAGEPSSLFTITVDQDCLAILRAQGLDLKSRPIGGQRVQVKRVVNQNAARENVDVTGQVHKSIVSVGAKASAELGLQLAGVDVLTTDISRPLAETGGVINEVNASPGLHHHYLTAEQRDPAIAESVLRYCMATSSYPYAI